MLKLHDTATGTIKPLTLRRNDEVSMYVCGPTVYGPPHLGHGRFALSFDVLRRYIEFKGLRVIHVSNITDIDDKIIERAGVENVDCATIASTYEKTWWESMDKLGVLRPTYVPHAVSYVEAMVNLIVKLFDLDVAYELSDGIYLDVSKVSDYGLLAHQDLASLKSGARVEIDENKRSPLDFVLWKLAKPGEPRWPSPFGNGRPGWHTECVVMSLDLLGDGFDIHGGAQDLIFPHHENERAQAVALNRVFASHWVHNGWVTVSGEKMSKSLGNYTNLEELLNSHDSRAYRLLVLRSHYRSPIEVTKETLSEADTAIKRLDRCANRFNLQNNCSPRLNTAMCSNSCDITELKKFEDAMDDDLDTARAVAQIFDLINKANLAKDNSDDSNAELFASSALLFANALGLEAKTESDSIDSFSESLRLQREEARKNKQFDEADRLRVELEELGWTVEDSKDGTKLSKQ